MHVYIVYMSCYILTHVHVCIPYLYTYEHKYILVFTCIFYALFMYYICVHIDRHEKYLSKWEQMKKKLRLIY